MDNQSLYDYYNSIFEGVVANTKELKEECYRIRYDVYCKEYSGFEDASQFPDGLERDAYDGHSAHALLRYKPLNIFVGTVRLILNPSGVKAGSLPIDALARDNNIKLPHHPPHTVAEISRFCIIKDFRRRSTDTIAGSSYTRQELGTAANQQRIIPSMSLGLISMIELMAQRNGIAHYCAEMEPFLLTFLTKLGIHFNHIGPMIEFHGQRQLCHISREAFVARVLQERKEVWDIITDQGRYLEESKVAVAL